MMSVLLPAFLLLTATCRAAVVAWVPATPSVAFVRAVEYDPLIAWREDAFSACTRFNMIPASAQVLLSTDNHSPVKWNLELLTSITHALGFSVAAHPLTGCCATSMWCTRTGIGPEDFECSTNGLGSYYYSNYGWMLNDTYTPVYACQTPGNGSLSNNSGEEIVQAINVTQALASLPVVMSAMSVGPRGGFSSARVRIDGRLLGDTAGSLQVMVAGAQCTNVDVCQNVCAQCTASSDCGDDKVCFRYGGAGYCLRLCNEDNSCPCGTQCFTIVINPLIGYTENVCVSPVAGAFGMSAICRGLPEPLTNGSDSSLECSIPQTTLPFTRQLYRRSSAKEIDVLPGFRELAQPARRLQSLAGDTTMQYAPDFSYRYGGACFGDGALGSGLLGAVVVRNGVSSAGLDRSLVPNNTWPASSDTAWDTLPYSSGPAGLNWTFANCLRDADCGFADLSSEGTCVIPNGYTAGCCVFHNVRSQISSSDPHPTISTSPAGMEYFLLPAEVSSIIPIPPPPLGNGDGTNANMVDRNPSTNPYAIFWDVRNVWYQTSAAMSVKYELSSASYVDDGPPGSVALPFNISMFGGETNMLYVSPNGFVRGVPRSPCSNGFQSSQCALSNSYVGLIGPLIADFDPGHYAVSEIWAGPFNASGIVGARASAGKSHVGACIVWLNMGLWNNNANGRIPPSPSFTFQLCVHGDGGVRIRYADAIGVPGLNPGGWVVNASITTEGGAPTSTAWMAAARSLDAGWNVAPEMLDEAFPGFSTATEDVAVDTPSNVLLSRKGVRQGATAAFCTLQPIACVVPSCGPAGTTVSLNWKPPACGLGFEALLLNDASRLPRIVCQFGDVAAPALVHSGAGGTFSVSCEAPAQPPAIGGYGTTVPLRVQLLAPANMYGYASSPSFVGRSAAPASDDVSKIGIGSPAIDVNASQGIITIPLDIYGVDLVTQSRDNASTLIAHTLMFTYSTSATCGCAPSAVSMCDSCGVCGGSGLNKDCSGTCFGTAVIDECGVCSGGTTNHAINANKDCNGVCFGPDTSCSGSNSPSDPNLSEAGIALTVIVIIALVTCSVALFAMLAYFGWMAVVRRRMYGQRGPWNLADMPLSLPPGLSDDTIATMPIITFNSDPEHQKQRSASVAQPDSTGEQDVEGPARESDDTCAICLEKYADGDRLRVMPPCRHRFHIGCSDEWLRRSNQCPVCRADLRGLVEIEEQEALQLMRTSHRRTTAASPHSAPANAQAENGANQPSARRAPTTVPVRVVSRESGPVREVELPPFAPQMQAPDTQVAVNVDLNYRNPLRPSSTAPLSSRRNIPGAPAVASNALPSPTRAASASRPAVSVASAYRSPYSM
jgi:hypothetical protein